jgi:hypothetical protein
MATPPCRREEGPRRSLCARARGHRLLLQLSVDSTVPVGSHKATRSHAYQAQMSVGVLDLDRGGDCSWSCDGALVCRPLVLGERRTSAEVALTVFRRQAGQPGRETSTAPVGMIHSASAVPGHERRASRSMDAASGERPRVIRRRGHTKQALVRAGAEGRWEVRSGFWDAKVEGGRGCTSKGRSRNGKKQTGEDDRERGARIM